MHTARCHPAWVLVFFSTLAGCSLVASPDDFSFVAPDAGTSPCTTASECTARPNAVLDCQNSRCVIASCSGDFEDCDGMLENGCEANPTSDLNHCGACGNVCNDDNASVSCTGGNCVIDGCNTGFDDCNSRADDGCETDLSLPASCGTCVRLCPPELPVCDATSDPAICVESCGAPGVICGMSCIDIETDTQHCGECDTTCPDRRNATPTCAARTCGFDCETGFEDCNATEGDGCEIDTTTDVMHCGGCHRACSGGNVVWGCTNSECTMTGCEGTFRDCDGDTLSCEIDIASDSDHCGGCMQACDGPCVDEVCDPVVDASMGFATSCAVRMSGDTYCWGHNTRGTVGDETGLHRPIPTQVVGIGGTGVLDAVAISTLGASPSQSTTCAILRNGKLTCWGADTYGTVGDGNNGGIEFSPKAVTSMDSEFDTAQFRQVDVGYENVCAVDTDDRLWCWGRNLFGELGTEPHDPTPPPSGTSLRPRAERIDLGGAVTQVAVGQNFVCAIRDPGDVLCWGQGLNGQLGVMPPPADRFTPTPIGQATDGATINDAIDIDAGSQFACVLRAAGTTYCWGVGTYGRLGQGSEDNAQLPTPATVLGTGATDLVVGSHFTCVKTPSGRYQCVGRGEQGQLGNGALDNAVTTAAQVSVLGTDAQLYCGSLGCLGVEGGLLYAWGSDTLGQLGVDQDILREVPAAMVNDTGAVATDISAVRLGAFAGCYETLSLGTRCFGQGSNRQLGNGSTVTTAVPAQTSGALLSGIARAGHFGCGIDATVGQPYCWGTNPQGLGNDPSTNSASTPVPINLTSAATITVGSHLTIGFGCAIEASPGPIVCWGTNANDQLGRDIGVATEDPIPNTGDHVIDATTSVPLSNAVAVVGGARHACAIHEADRRVVCWGLGTSGQLGHGAAASSDEAVRAGTLTNVIDLALGEFHTCAIAGSTPTATEGTVYCWGFRNDGAVGRNMDGNQDTPFNVGIVDAVAIGTGASHSCAVRAGGEIQCWGLNDEAQLGDGTRTKRRMPVVSHSVPGAVDLSRGAREVKTTCAVTATGGAVCWGRCVDGSCGTGERFFESTPLPVQGLGG